MKKRIAIELILFALVAVFACFAQDKPIGKKQVTLGATVHSVTLTWNNPTTCVDGSACTPTGNKIYKLVGVCPASGTAGFTLLSTSTTPITTYTDSGITPGTYCYYVTASNANGESAASNTAAGTLAQPALSPPTSLSVVAQ